MPTDALGANPATGPHAAVETVWRIEAPRLIAGLTGLVRDLDLAQELAQDAMVAALEQWPAEGVPRNPGAWLMTTAKRRAIDRMRRDATYRRKLEQLGRERDAPAPDVGTLVAEDDGIGDDLLRLMFVACHPVLTTQARAALTLRLLGGLSTAEIARAFLVPEPTIAQRIVRAKQALAKAGVPYEVPQGAELGARLPSVLEVIYLIFNEGYTATAGSDWMRPTLCEEAIRLGRVLARLAPREPEVHALVALMELQASRTAARTGPDGEPVLLADQNRGRWDRLLIGRGLAALDRAEALPGAEPGGATRTAGGAPGSYLLQARIAACHARARRFEDTDWTAIADLYEQLARAAPSPVVELNRAVALSMAYGPAAGLALLDQVAGLPALREYHLLPTVRGDLLAKLGRHAEGAAELERAAGLTANAQEQALLQERAHSCKQLAEADPAG